MTIADAKKLLPIIKAFSEGRVIQNGFDYDWTDIRNPTFCEDPSRYRIKSRKRVGVARGGTKK